MTDKPLPFESLPNDSRSSKPVPRSPHYRCKTHNYAMPARYLITLDRNRNCRLFFSSVRGGISSNTDIPHIVCNRSGLCIEQAATAVRRDYPQVVIVAMAIMPVQVIMIVDVQGYLTRKLHDFVARFKAHCTTLLRQADNIFADSKASLFQPGFHDRILPDDTIFSRAINHLAEAPRRMLIKRYISGLYTTRHWVTAAGQTFEAYGNIFLLRDIAPKALKVSRSFTAEQLEALKETWKETARGHGVLVSPFISKAERELRFTLGYKGARFIHILNESLEDMSRIHPKDLEMCAKGRMLLLVPHPLQLGMTRTRAEWLNTLAQSIADGALQNFVLKRRP
ncbi:MAG: hypothetical protein K2H47_01290 [Muribaculaceae bacterium]|nr:hypothetical protein [Muribaculaceae bacterium]